MRANNALHDDGPRDARPAHERGRRPSHSHRRLRMPNFEQLYDQFQISDTTGDSLRRLANPPLQLLRPTDRVIVETVIVENGERRIVGKEEQDAKLV